MLCRPKYIIASFTTKLRKFVLTGEGQREKPPPLVLLKFKHILNRKCVGANVSAVTIYPSPALDIQGQHAAARATRQIIPETFNYKFLSSADCVLKRLDIDYCDICYFLVQPFFSTILIWRQSLLR